MAPIRLVKSPLSLIVKAMRGRSAGAELIENQISGAPGIRFGNIFILAGILALDGLTNGAVYALLALATVLLFDGLADMRGRTL